MSAAHSADSDALEWQAAEGSRTLHIIDTTRPSWKNADGSRRLSGPRALCGRYPQRNADGWWFGWPVKDSDASTGTTMYLTQCPDCRTRITSPEVGRSGAQD